MKLFNNLLTATIFASLLASCSSDIDSPISDNSSNLQGRTITLTVGVSDPDNVTRTWYDTNNGDLGVTWAQDDKLVVTTDGVSGVNLGVLDYDMDKNNDGLKATAYFKGVITLPEGANKIHLTYLGSGKTTEELKTVNGDYTIDVSSQSGSIKDFSAHDVQTSEAITIPDGATTFDVSTTLIRNISFGHFDLQLPVKLDANDVVTVSGADVAAIQTALNVNLNGNIPSAATNSQGAITVTMRYGTTEFNETDLYLAMVPQTTDLTFTVTKDDVTYTATLGSNTWLSTEYYRNDTDDAGIPVTNWTEIRPIDDTVGPTFEVNGKKFKFTKANLAWDRVERLWYLHDEQYTCLYSKGWYDKDGNILKLKNTTGNSADDIDLYNFGATGEYLSYYWAEYNNGQGLMIDQQINVPEYWAYQGGDRTINSRTDGGKNPTQDQTCNTSGTGNFLQNGIQDTLMDWGYSYGKQVGEGHYFTLYSSEWKAVLDNHFVCGATITDIINPVTKKAITGLMIFEANDATTVRNLLNGIATLGSAAFKDITGSGFSYDGIKITVENFKTVEASGKMVFLPMAGLGNTQTINSVGKTDGAYWTADAGSSIDYISALMFRFTANSQFNAALTINRMAGCSVRLVKEVK